MRLLILPWLMSPYASALSSAPCSSGCTGTSRDLPPLHERTLIVGLGVSSDRSRTSRSSASETRRPARHCCRISSFAFGLGVGLMIAFASSPSRYSDMRFWRLGAGPSGDCGGHGRTLTLI